MVKLMRLDGVNNMEEGKAWLPGFMAGHNARFAAAPADPKDAHRPVLQDPETPARILCPHHQRTLSRDLTFRLHHRQYQVQTPGKGCGLRGAKVAGCEGWDDNITVIYRGKVRLVRLLAAGKRRYRRPTAKPCRTAWTRPRRSKRKDPAGNPRPTIPGAGTKTEKHAPVLLLFKGPPGTMF